MGSSGINRVHGEKNLGNLLILGLVKPSQVAEIKSTAVKTCQELGPESLALTESFAISDTMLSAPIALDWVQYNTPQHTTTHHNTPQHTTTQHNTTQHTTPHHNTTQHTTTQHNTTQHNTPQHNNKQQATSN